MYIKRTNVGTLCPICCQTVECPRNGSHRPRTRPITSKLETTDSRTITFGKVPANLIPPLYNIFPLLVLPRCPSIGLRPFDVASTDGLIVAVFSWLPETVVAKVVVGPLLASSSALLLRNTNANPGAGILTGHTPFWQVMV